MTTKDKIKAILSAIALAALVAAGVYIENTGGMNPVQIRMHP